AKQFESLFVEMMLKSMREASLGGGIFDSDAGELYQGMFDKQVALDLSRGKGLGIAELLIRQLSPPVKADPKARIDEVPRRDPKLIPLDAHPLAPTLQPIAPTPVPQPPMAIDVVQPMGPTLHDEATEPAASTQAAAAEPVAREWKPSTPLDFVREILPHARAAAQALGVHPLGLVAQAALETGWGRHVIPRADGASSFNLFGIKAGTNWGGEKAVSRTLEFEGSVPVRKQESFRSYGSLAESFADYVKLIGSNPRYREVLAQGADALGFAESLGRSGYATDPDYSSKIKGLITGDTLRGALAALKISTTEPM
ncbi:MAG TPA: flagellar assembly peptidoglycan hydrolase FlgJ, partial [Steroidobacteraceae bacterium]|nr:flagellar assembly peptidoglycan hydrolase FlgJ [Steroidobacteraceae bacterium]